MLLTFEVRTHKQRDLLPIPAAKYTCISVALRCHLRPIHRCSSHLQGRPRRTARGDNVWTPLQDLPQGWRSIACLQIVCIYCPCLVWCSWQHVVAAVHPSVVSPVSGISLLRSVLCWSGAPLCTDGARGRQHRGRATHAGDPNREAAPHLAEPTRAGWWVWKFGKSSVKKIRAI